MVRQSPSLHFMVSVYVEQILGSLPKQQDLSYLFKMIKKKKKYQVTQCQIQFQFLVIGFNLSLNLIYLINHFCLSSQP